MVKLKDRLQGKESMICESDDSDVCDPKWRLKCPRNFRPSPYDIYRKGPRTVDLKFNCRGCTKKKKRKRKKEEKKREEEKEKKDRIRVLRWKERFVVDLWLPAFVAGP